MKAKTITLQPLPTSLRPAPAAAAAAPPKPSDMAVRASHIRQAAIWLIGTQKYSLAELSNITGGCNRTGQGGRRRDRLHKNSVIKIKDLGLHYAVQWPINHKKASAYLKKMADAEASGVPLDEQVKPPKMRWVAAPPRSKGWLNQAGREQWMWNPQVDTIEKLELILQEAVRLGFVPETDDPHLPEQKPVAVRKSHAA